MRSPIRLTILPVKYRLVHLSGSLAGRVRDVEAAELVLGRDPEAAQVVFGAEDRLVSRRHAILVDDGGVLLIRDLDSSTGTFVDDEDVEEAELRHGDVFELGRGGPRVRVELTADGGTLVLPASALPKGAAAPAPGVLRPKVPVGPGSKLRLTVLSGSRKGAVLDLGGAGVRIGRTAGNSVALAEDRVVSAQHAKLIRLEDEYVLIDLDSRNGTYLNGSRVERTPVANGDVVSLGPGGPELKIE